MGVQYSSGFARRGGGLLLGVIFVLFGRPLSPDALSAVAEQETSLTSAAMCFKLQKTSHKSVRRETGIVTVQVATLEVLDGKWTLWHAGGELEVAPGRSFTVSPADVITEIEGRGREFKIKSIESGAVVLEEQRRYILPGTTTPLTLRQVSVRHVDVLFKGVVENPFKLRLDVKFNWGRGSQTEYLQVGESLHGYMAYPLEIRSIEVEEPGQPPREEKRRFITLRRPGTDPITIEMGKTAPVTERIATLEAAEKTWRVFHRGHKLSEGEKVFEVFEGCVIGEIEGDRRAFKVTRINDERVILEGANEHVLKLPSPAHK